VLTALTFEVEVEDTSSAAIYNLFGKYQLVLSIEHVTLFDGRMEEPVLSWHYQYVALLNRDGILP
jgi:hypothetical protein